MLLLVLLVLMVFRMKYTKAHLKCIKINSTLDHGKYIRYNSERVAHV